MDRDPGVVVLCELPDGQYLVRVTSLMWTICQWVGPGFPIEQLRRHEATHLEMLKDALRATP